MKFSAKSHCEKQSVLAAVAEKGNWHLPLVAYKASGDGGVGDPVTQRTKRTKRIRVIDMDNAAHCLSPDILPLPPLPALPASHLPERLRPPRLNFAHLDESHIATLPSDSLAVRFAVISRLDEFPFLSNFWYAKKLIIHSS